MIGYTVFKNDVLKQSNGAVVHKLNGCLGVILNALQNKLYWETQGNGGEVQQADLQIKKAIETIKQQGVKLNYGDEVILDNN